MATRKNEQEPERLHIILNWSTRIILEVGSSISGEGTREWSLWLPEDLEAINSLLDQQRVEENDGVLGRLTLAVDREGGSLRRWQGWEDSWPASGSRVHRQPGRSGEEGKRSHLEGEELRKGIRRGLAVALQNEEKASRRQRIGGLDPDAIELGGLPEVS